MSLGINVSHQHRLFKLAEKYPVEFYFLKNNVRAWHDFIRPLSDKVHWVAYYEEGKYDLAILHLDQQCSNTKLGKAKLYQHLNEVIDCPKIVINHGSPMIPEYGYDEDVVINGGWIIDQGSKESLYLPGIKKMIGDSLMVVNSYTARDRWGWGYPIIHGMDKDEWYDLPDKEPRVVMMISAGGMDKYYNRTLISGIKDRLMEKYNIPLFHITVNVKFEPSGDWEQYRKFLGESLIYINPTLDSPMPSARTEAMMSGCCVLTSKYHDADQFIENGVNGFIVPDNPNSYADLINTLMKNYKATRLIGEEGRKTAIKVFSEDRFLRQWWDMINLVLEKGTKEAYNILEKRIDKEKEETYGKRTKEADEGTDSEDNEGTTKRKGRTKGTESL